MTKYLRKHREIVLLLLDIIFIVLAYFIGLLIRLEFYISAADYRHLYALVNNIFFIVLINVTCNYIFKVNNSLWKYASISEVIRITASALLANGIWFILVIVIPISSFIRSLPIIATLILLALELGTRLVYRWYRKEETQKNRTKNAIIIGAGDAGNLMMRDLLSNDKYDCSLLGFFDDASSKQGKMIAGFKVLGKISDIPAYCKDVKVDVAFISIVNCDKQRRQEIMSLLKTCGLKTYITDTIVSKSEEKLTVRNVSIEDLLGRGQITLNDAEISDYIKDKVVMVTGAGGSIGSELVRQMLKFNPKQLVLFDIYENNLYSLQQEIVLQRRLGNITNNTELVCLIGSVRDKKRVNEIMEEYHPNVLFHAAAHKHVPLMEDSPREAIKNNVFGTMNTIECCIKNHVGKFILISTDKAVNPTNVMGATKRMCEMIVQSKKDNGITKMGAVRFGNVLGSNGSVIPLFKDEIENGGPVTVTDPEIKRYFMTIPEATQLVLQAGAFADHGDIFVLDMGQPVKILKLAEDLISLSGLKPYEDIDIVFTGLRAGEKMYEEISLGTEKRYKTANDLIYVNEPLDISESVINEKLSKLENFLSLQDEIAKEDMLEIIKDKVE